jgi:hypothetical protein
MNKRGSILIIVIFFTAYYSCKKPQYLPNSKQLVVPISPYFPCYPKSYWTYRDSTGVITTEWVDDEYISYSVKTADDSINEPELFPRINGNYYYNGKKIVRFKGRYDYYYPTIEFDVFEPVVVTSIEVEITTKYLYGWNQKQFFIQEIDSMQVNGQMFDTVIVNKTIFSNSDKPDAILKYFSKNVGLILEQVIYHQDSIPDTVTVKSLTGYQIFKN